VSSSFAKFCPHGYGNVKSHGHLNEGVCSNHRYDVQTTKNMEIMKPGKKEGKPNCDEDVFLERILQTTKIQLSVLSEWMQL
jgi:hypothetical protein